MKPLYDSRESTLAEAAFLEGYQLAQQGEPYRIADDVRPQLRKAHRHGYDYGADHRDRARDRARRHYR